jgi:bis(5'-nucleosyl)-tetraphosphatase (symmetrical)
MSTFAIGDIQGCYSALLRLLDHIHFDSAKDILWFTGDLVNRGSQSLETLRFVKGLGTRQHTVLGNHDLHLLALAFDKHKGLTDDTLIPILQAPDREDLLDWLCQQPLLHHDETLGYTMVHAGLAPSWDLDTAKKLAHEVETILRSEHKLDFLHHMYGNHPDQWNDSLTGYERLRCITNYFTRMRFCYPDGRLELQTKGTLEHSGALIPWFKLPHRANSHLKIIFGHWAALCGVTDTPNVFALDTGCVWGECLTAMRLEDEQCFNVKCG